MLIRTLISACSETTKHTFSNVIQKDCFGLDSAGKGPLIAREACKEIILLTRQQFVITHTVRQTEIPALLANWFINAPSVKMLSPKERIVSAYIIVKKEHA